MATSERDSGSEENSLEDEEIGFVSEEVFITTDDSEVKGDSSDDDERFAAESYARYSRYRVVRGVFPEQEAMNSYFLAVAGADGHMEAEELQRCLTEVGLSGGDRPFKLEDCSFMIALQDSEMMGQINFRYFKELGRTLAWLKQNFVALDADSCWTIDAMTFQRSLRTMGYNLSPTALNLIARKYCVRGRVTYNDYIACCVKLQVMTHSFMRRCAALQGMLRLQYEGFMQSVMSI